ncbi:hypothetical protein BT69DRAFT_1335348 [Atractiella rhizophila]|nr:hypothetical protein BT69DRAFT_1335348 [Atractiella rhizophila]
MLLQKLADKYERKNMQWALLAHIVREGGFKIVLACRYSAIPSHLTTAIFSTCGTGFWAFTIAAILSLPQKLPFVYAGVIFESSADGTETTSDRIIFATTFGGTIVVTLIVMYYIQLKMRASILDVRQNLRVKRAAALNEVSTPAYLQNGKHQSLTMSDETYSDVDLKSASHHNPHSKENGKHKKSRSSFLSSLNHNSNHTKGPSLEEGHGLASRAAPMGMRGAGELEMQERPGTGGKGGSRIEIREKEGVRREEDDRHRGLYDQAFGGGGERDQSTMSLHEAPYGGHPYQYPREAQGRGVYARQENVSQVSQASFEDGYGYAR